MRLADPARIADCRYSDRLPVNVVRDQRLASLRKAGRESLEAKREHGSGSATKKGMVTE